MPYDLPTSAITERTSRQANADECDTIALGIVSPVQVGGREGLPTEGLA